MKHLIFFLSLIYTTISYTQNGPWKAGLYLTGFYRDNGSIVDPKVNNQIHIAPEATFKYKKYFEMGAGLIFQDLTRKYNPESYSVDGVGQIVYGEWEGKKSKLGGLKFIHRANIQLPRKLVFIIGLDVIGYIGNEKEISDPKYPIYINGILSKYTSDKNLQSIGLYNYAGFSYPVTKRFSLSAYGDLFNFSVVREKEKTLSSVNVNGLFDTNGTLRNASFVKLGGSYTF